MRGKRIDIRGLVVVVLLLLFGGRVGAMVLTERYNVSYLDLRNGLPHDNVSAIFAEYLKRIE